MNYTCDVCTIYRIPKIQEKLNTLYPNFDQKIPYTSIKMARDTVYPKPLAGSDMCGLDRSSGFGGCRLQHPPKPPTVFGARCVSRSPMKYLKHVLKLHVQYLPKYSYTRYIHPLLARTRSPKYN